MVTPRCYLDAVSGQPWHVAACSTLSAAAELTWSASQGVHFEAATTRNLTSQAHASVALGLGVEVDRILAVHGLGNACRSALRGVKSGQTVATSSISRLGMLQAAKTTSPDVFEIPVTGDGFLADFEPHDVIVVQAGNPEVGTLDDLSEIRRRHPDSLMVVDATEWVGRMPSLPVGDIVIVRSSSWAGPSSVCFVISTTALGDQHSPTLNSRQRSMLAPDPVLLLAAATALENVRAEGSDQSMQSAAIDYLRQHIAEIKDVDVHGSATSRLPHIVSFSTLHVDSEALATELDKRGFSVGSGSACLSDDGQPSHVLAAMQRLTHGNVRVSIPLNFEQAHIIRFVDELKATIEQLRATTGVINL